MTEKQRQKTCKKLKKKPEEKFYEFYDLRKSINHWLNPNDMLRNPWEYQLIMGSHLQKPKTEKEISSGDGNGFL